MKRCFVGILGANQKEEREEKGTKYQTIDVDGESVELQQWRMVCDVDVDVGRSLGLKKG